MKQEMILISKEQVDLLLVQMQRAEGYCRNARPASREPDRAELMSEPTAFYSGASGFAGATLRSAIQTLESHLPLK